MTCFIHSWIGLFALCAVQLPTSHATDIICVTDLIYALRVMRSGDGLVASVDVFLLFVFFDYHHMLILGDHLFGMCGALLKLLSLVVVSTICANTRRISSYGSPIS